MSFFDASFAFSEFDIHFSYTGSFYAVAVAAYQQTYGGIYLSSDSGNSWTLLPAADQTLSWQSVTIDSTGENLFNCSFFVHTTPDLLTVLIAS